jgi:PST family polysaccharide transporter
MNRSEQEVFATIKNLFATKTRRRLFENFLSLSFLQFANYIFPLITLPYLVRVLGPEKYGLIAFAQAFIGYFQILTDYGFNLSATREISINRENKEKVSEIFSSVMIIKFFLLLLSLGLMTIIVFSFKKFRQDWLIYYLAFGMVLGQTLFPIWLFQGMERMRYITILNVLAKLIFTIAIFIFVKRSSDYLYVPLLNSLGFFVAGVLALWIVFKDFGVFFRIPSFKDLKYHLKEGWHVFVSLVFITGYTNSRIFAVGLFSPNNAITGYYAIAEKLMGIVQTFPLVSVIQTLYPRLSKIYAENKLKAKFIADKFQRYTTIAYLIICITFFIIAPKVVEIVAGSSYEETVLAFRLLLIAALFINANAFRVNFLLVSGNADIFAKIHLVMGSLGSIMVFLFCYFFSYIGTAISIILIALIVLIQTIIEDKRIWRTYIN